MSHLSLSLQRAGPSQNLNEVALHASAKLGDQKSEDLYSSVHVEEAMEMTTRSTFKFPPPPSSPTSPHSRFYNNNFMQSHELI